jgi:thiamine transporter 2/3
VAYFSYLYAIVKKKHYKRITSYIRTASILGKFLAYTLGQVLISTEFGDYLLLNQVEKF